MDDEGEHGTQAVAALQGVAGVRDAFKCGGQTAELLAFEHATGSGGGLPDALGMDFGKLAGAREELLGFGV